MDTPKPRVMKPTISSPGSGVQHLANFTGQLSMPSTTTPSVLLVVLRGMSARAAGLGWAALSLAYSSFTLPIRRLSCSPP